MKSKYVLAFFGMVCLSVMFIVGAATEGCSAPVGKIAPVVADASAKRDAICNFAEAWKADTPELVRVQQLCKAGSDLKTIAAAYAGCSKPAEDAGAPPVVPPANATTDAGT